MNTWQAALLALGALLALLLAAAGFTAALVAGIALARTMSSGMPPRLRLLMSRLRHPRVRVPRDGEPLSDAEMREFGDVMRGWAMKPDAELAGFEKDIEEMLQEGAQ